MGLRQPDDAATTPRPCGRLGGGWWQTEAKILADAKATIEGSGNDDISFDPLSDDGLATLGAMVQREQERRAKVAAIFAAQDAEAKLGD
jgi:hypothetical protein